METVLLPDGTTIEVPEDITPEELERLKRSLVERFGSPSARRTPSAVGGAPAFPDRAAPTFPDDARSPSDGGIATLRPSASSRSRKQRSGDEGTVLGSAWEMVKSIPRGARQFALMAQQGIAGLHTPDEDTAREKDLRRRLRDLMNEIDPKYRDAHLPQLGFGLGQAFGLMGLGAAGSAAAGAVGLPAAVVGTGLAMTGGSLMMAGDAAGRVADYEERTGEDVSKAKEIIALAAGAGLGLTEAMPLAKYARRIGFSGKAATDAAENAIEHVALMSGKKFRAHVLGTSLQQAGEEALQEAAAGFGQSWVAKQLYDEDALANAGTEALREALIGGEVGAITDVLVNMGTRLYGGRFGRVGKYRNNQVLAERLRKRREDGEYGADEAMKELVTGVDVVAAKEGILERLTAGKITEEQAEMERAEVDERAKDTQTLRESILASIDAGTDNDFEIISREQSRKAQEELKARFDAGDIKQEELDSGMEFILQRDKTFVKEFGELQAALLVERDGVIPGKAAEDEATAEAERIELEATLDLDAEPKNIEAEIATMVDREREWKQSIYELRASQNNVRKDSNEFKIAEERIQMIQADIDALLKDKADNELLLEQVNSRIEAEKARQLQKPTIDEVAEGRLIGIDEVVEQIELGIRPTQKDMEVQAEIGVAAQVGKLGAQIAELKSEREFAQASLALAESEKKIELEPEDEARRLAKIEALDEQLLGVEANIKSLKDPTFILETGKPPPANETQRKAQNKRDLEASKAERKRIKKELRGFGDKEILSKIKKKKKKIKELTFNIGVLEGGRPVTGSSLLTRENILISGLNKALEIGYLKAAKKEAVRKWKNSTETLGKFAGRLVTREQRNNLTALLKTARAQPDLQMTSAQAVDAISGILGGGLNVVYTATGKQPPPKGTYVGRPVAASTGDLTVIESDIGYHYPMPVVRTKIKPAERKSSQEQTQKAIDSLLGFWGNIDIDTALDIYVRDKKLPRRLRSRWKVTLGKLGSQKLQYIVKRLEKTNYDITENVLRDVLTVKNFWAPRWVPKGQKSLVLQMDFIKELVKQTLGTRAPLKLNKESWDALTRGEREAVFARLLRTEPRPVPAPKAKTEAIKRREIKRAQDASPLVKTETEKKIDRDSLLEARSRFEVFKSAASSALLKAGLTDIAPLFTADADSAMSQVEDVVVNGAFEMTTDEKGNAVPVMDKAGKPVFRAAYADGPVASLENHGMNMVFNLSQIMDKYPDGLDTNPEILIKDATVHEGSHVYFMRDYFKTGERRIFEVYGKKEKVPKEVDRVAAKEGLYWNEYVGKKYPELKGPDLIEETTVHILDALAAGKIPAAKAAGKIGNTKRKLTSIFNAIVGATEASNIIPVIRVFEKVQSREFLYRKAELEGRGLPEGVGSLQYVERAKEEDLRRLTDAIKEGDQAKIDAIADEILDSRMEYEGDQTPQQLLMESLVSELRARRDIADTPSQVLPVFNKAAIEAGEIDPVLLNAVFRFRDGRKPPFRMPRSPRELRLFRWGTQTAPRSEVAQRIYQDYVAPPDASPVLTGETTGQAPAVGVIEGVDSHNRMQNGDFAGTREEWVDMNEYSAAQRLRYWILDKRLPMWFSHKRAEIRRRAMKNFAEGSAIDAWRWADLSLNFLQGVMQEGPLTYLGREGFTFMKQYVIDPETGQRREVKPLADILSPLFAGSPEFQAETQWYISAKRILDVKAELDKAEAARAEVEGSENEELIEARDRALHEWQTEWSNIFKVADKLTPEGPERLSELKRAQDGVAKIEAAARDGTTEMQAVMQFAQEYGDFNHHIIEFAYQTGMITRERKELLQSMSYVPFYRERPIGEQGNTYNMASERGGERRRGEFLINKALEGSFAPLDGDLAAMIAKNVQSITRDGMWNVAAQRSMRDEMAGGTAVDVTDMDSDARKKVARENGLSDIVIEVHVNGVGRKFLVADAMLSKAMMTIGISPQQSIENFFGKIIPNETVSKGLASILVGSSRFLREMVTRSPPFIAKNILRDAWQASVTYGGGPQMALKAIKYALQPESLRLAQRRGISIGVDYTPNPETFTGHELKKLKREQLHWSNPVKLVSNVWAGLGRMARQSEVATRMVVYDMSMQKSGGDAAKAFTDATEIMNYGRRGASPLFSALTAMAPFMNGRIQGLDVTLRTHMGSLDVPGLHTDDFDASAVGRAKRMATALGRGSFLMMATLLYYLSVKDDEEYKNAREDLKNDWWLVPLGGGLPGIKIPIPFEVGTFYKVIPEQILRAIFEEEHDIRDVRDETFRQIRASLSLDLRPQLVRPMIDAMFNRDAFQRDQIVPTWMDEKVASLQQRGPYTSQMAIMLAEMTDKVPLVRNLDFLTSPMKIEYMSRQYLGTIGSYGLLVADRIATDVAGRTPVGTAADIPFPILDVQLPFKLPGMSSLISLHGTGFNRRTIMNMPGLEGFLYDPSRGGGYQEDFYELVDDIDKLVTTMGQIAERPEKREFEKENESLLGHRRRLAHFNKRMEHWRSDRDTLFDRNDISDEEKRRMLQRMFESRDDMLEEMLKIMADVREDRGIMEAIFGTRP